MDVFTGPRPVNTSIFRIFLTPRLVIQLKAAAFKHTRRGLALVPFFGGEQLAAGYIPQIKTPEANTAPGVSTS
jgi:hypothetical protein